MRGTRNGGGKGRLEHWKRGKSMSRAGGHDLAGCWGYEGGGRGRRGVSRRRIYGWGGAGGRDGGGGGGV